MGEAVASGPIRAQWAGSSLWVVHTFFVRAADNPSVTTVERGPYCLRKVRICSPMARSSRISNSPSENQRWRRSRSSLSVRKSSPLPWSPVCHWDQKSHGGNWVTSKTRPGRPVHPGEDGPLPAGCLPSLFHPCNTRRASPSCRKRDRPRYQGRRGVFQQPQAVPDGQLHRVG
jgi:hypothetical protein